MTTKNRIDGPLTLNDALTLVAGTFTPTLDLGGTEITADASPGSYSNQTGEYIRVGQLLWFNALITLSAKGGATGNARVVLNISGTSFQNFGDFIAVSYPLNWTGLNGAPWGSTDNNNNWIILNHIDATGTGRTAVSDSELTDSSRIEMSGIVRVIEN